MTRTSVDVDERERTDRSAGEASLDRTVRSCPECDGRVYHDEEHGERTCADCGLVLDADEIDRGPEWRSFADESGDRTRVGAPVTELLHDRGLSTKIGWRDRDAQGNAIPARKRARMQRLRTWDERARAKTPQERNLQHAFGEIERMASALGLSEPCRETAGVIYRRAVDEGLLPGRSIEAMTTASLYAAARQHNAPRTLDVFETVSRVEKLAIQRAYRYLARELGLGIEPTDPVQYLRQFASELDLSPEAERTATDLLEIAKREELHSGRSPAGLAAAALYAGTYLTNEAVTQQTIGETARVSEVTIRDRYQEILDAYADYEES